ncbi:MAG: hypothetical protein IJ446_11060 [Oscillospiraceae bacterium]|nr:hypothetical protein [Oscillospiraceae bacterium]
MSIGVGAYGTKVSEDDIRAEYSYTSYNLNNKLYRNPEKIEDGLIIINKKALAEKENILSEECIKAGELTIINCSNTWKTFGRYDCAACWLICKLRRVYLLNGTFPDSLSFHK